MTILLEEKLRKLGLGKNEANVYLSILELGKVRAGTIIEHTGIHRNLVYEALQRLVESKLVTRLTRRGVAVFMANSPDTLLNRVEEQLQTAKDVIRELKQRQIKKPHDIKIYEGLEGVIESRKASLLLKTGETAYMFGGSPLIYSQEVSDMWISYSKRRVNKSIVLKMLCDKTVPQEYIDMKNKKPFSYARRLPIDVELPAIFEMYGDTLNIAVPGKEPVVFSLRNHEAAQSLKNYFEYFWEKAGSTRPTYDNALQKRTDN